MIKEFAQALIDFIFGKKEKAYVKVYNK